MIKINVKKDWIYFEPDFMDNKACPKTERISCFIKYISQADQDGMTDRMIDTQKKGYRATKKIKYSKSNLQMITEKVKDIQNVAVVEEDKDGNELPERAIKTMEDMYYIPHLKGLYEEISSALDASNHLEEQERKN